MSMDSEFENSRIERLKKRLYSKSNDQPILDPTKGAVLEQAPVETPESQWGETQILERPASALAYKSAASKFFKTLFLISIIFCVIAGGIAAFIFIGNHNRISSIDISVTGPVSIAGGEKLALLVAVDNQNGVDMLNARVRIDYPEGAYVSTNTAMSLPRDERVLDTIKAGTQKQITFESILFGEENIQKDFTITVEYEIAGSKTSYTNNKDYSILLTKAPISLLIDYEKTVTSEQDTTIVLTAISNSTAKLENVLLKGIYPVGWSFTSADPAAVATTKDTWQLGSFIPGEKKKITLRGTIKGQEGEEKVFRFSLGAPQETDENKLSTSFVDSIATMTLERPFILTKLEIGEENKDGDIVANLGDLLDGTLNIKNNTSRDLVDVVVEIKPEGQVYDKYSVKTSDGFYKSTENTLYWDKVIKQDLKMMTQGSDVNVRFMFKTFSPEQLVQIFRNPQMNLRVSVTGKSIADDEGTKNINVDFVKKIKFTTQASMEARTRYNVGAFRNVGPVPPQAEQTTSYTLSFDLKNTFNHISEGKVTAVLPFYVQWVPQASSSIEKISFDTQTRVVTWNVGELAAGAGYTGATRTGSFQVTIAPSTSQVGTVPILASDIAFIGVDRFTGNMIQMRSPGLTTQVVDENLSGVVRK